MNNNMSNSEFHQLFINELYSIYKFENNWVAVMKEFENAATSKELKVTFRTHNLINMEAVLRLDLVFERLEVPVVHYNYELANHLLEDARRTLEISYTDGMIRDAALIISVQKMVHYTIASYGSLVTLADIMAHHQAGDLLKLILADRKKCDVELTALAENYINLEAAKS